MIGAAAFPAGDIGARPWLAALLVVSTVHAVLAAWLGGMGTGYVPPTPLATIEALLLPPGAQAGGGEPAAAEAPRGEEAAPPEPPDDPPQSPAEPTPEPMPEPTPMPMAMPEPDPAPQRHDPKAAPPKAAAKRSPEPQTRRASAPEGGSHPGGGRGGADSGTGGGPVTGPRYNAAYLNNPPPPYPAAARRRNLQGRVLIYAEVSTTGECAHAEVRTTSGHAALDEAALQAVRKWRFVPATRNGTPVPAGVEIPVVFRLEG